MNAILKTVLQRLALGFVTLFVVSALISASVELLPGDFAKAILGQAATPDTVKAFEKQVGIEGLHPCGVRRSPRGVGPTAAGGCWNRMMTRRRSCQPRGSGA